MIDRPTAPLAAVLVPALALLLALPGCRTVDRSDAVDDLVPAAPSQPAEPSGTNTATPAAGVDLDTSSGPGNGVDDTGGDDPVTDDAGVTDAAVTAAEVTAADATATPSPPTDPATERPEPDDAGTGGEPADPGPGHFDDAELAELERMLDEIDGMLTDIERDLEAD
ncbi:MAG: hypothetical protein AAFN30_07950 [Actinomycetota bacterium]